MAQRDGRRGSLMCSGWNLLFVHVADLEKRCVEHQKRFAVPFIAPLVENGVASLLFPSNVDDSRCSYNASPQQK